MSKLTICIAGKNSIAINVLEFVLLNYPDFEVVACINKTDIFLDGWQKSFGLFCKKKGVKIVDLEDLFFLDNLFFFSLEYDRLINVKKFKSKNLFNIHFSLLPSYKGMYTSAWPILNDEDFSGVTLHLIDNGIDTGDIIFQEKVSIKESFTARDLYLEYLTVGEFIIKSNFESLINSNYLATMQSNYKSSYYSKKSIDYSNLEINFQKTAREVMNQVRAFSFREYQLPKVLGVNIYNAKILESKTFIKPGSLISEDNKSLIFSTIDYDICLLKDRLSELFKAAEIGDLRRIQSIEKEGFEISSKNANGWDILIISAYHGQYEIVEWLVEQKKIDINSANYKGTTVVMYALTYASKYKDDKILFYLIEKGVDLSLVDMNGFNIFYYANLYDKNIYNKMSFFKNNNLF